MKKTILVILSAVVTGVLLALAVFGLTMLIQNDGTPEENDTAQELSGSGCYVTSFFSYTGEYPEDGSFERVENVAAVKIKNNSSVDIEQARIRVVTDKGEYTFLAVAWMAGTEMTVPEENRTMLADNARFESASIESISAFEEPPTLMHDVLDVSISGGIVNVKNVSDGDVDGSVKIYLKFRDADGFFGGTAFFVNAGALKAGEEISLDTGITSEKTLVPVFAVTEKGEKTE